MNTKKELSMRAVLREVARMAKGDGALDDEMCLATLLDYLALLGVPGASNAYFYLLLELEE